MARRRTNSEGVGRLWGIAGLGLVGLLLLATNLCGCAAMKQASLYPSARVADVKFGSLSLTSVTVNFDVEVKNPYSVALPLVGLDYALSSQGDRFLEGKIDADHSIPASGSEVVTMPVQVPFLELYKVVGDAKLGSKVPYEADLSLRVNAPILGEVALPMQQSGELPLPSLR